MGLQDRPKVLQSSTNWSDHFHFFHFISLDQQIKLNCNLPNFLLLLLSCAVSAPTSSPYLCSIYDVPLSLTHQCPTILACSSSVSLLYKLFAPGAGGGEIPGMQNIVQILKTFMITLVVHSKALCPF